MRSSFRESPWSLWLFPFTVSWSLWLFQFTGSNLYLYSRINIGNGIPCILMPPKPFWNSNLDKNRIRGWRKTQYNSTSIQTRRDALSRVAEITAREQEIRAWERFVKLPCFAPQKLTAHFLCRLFVVLLFCLYYQEFPLFSPFGLWIDSTMTRPLI